MPVLLGRTKMRQIILQNVSTAETRAVIGGAALLDNVEIIRSPLENLEYNVAHRSGFKEALPVGSVEFVREFMRVTGVKEPNFHPYPDQLKKFIQRFIFIHEVGRFRKFACVKGREHTYPPLTMFIKPAKIKLFNGFIFRGNNADYDEHDKEQYDLMMSLPDNEKIFISNLEEFQCEWRFYIDELAHGYDIIGSARYDPNGADDAPEVDVAVVRAAIAAMPNNHPYVLDFGVTKKGKSMLIEANDAWAIGLYHRAMRNDEYLQFLTRRWETIVSA